MRPTTLSTSAAGVGLMAIAGLHVAWGLGASFPMPDRDALADAVIGASDVPGPVPCFVVAGALATAATAVLGAPASRPGMRRIAAAGAVGVLATRGILGLAGRTDLVSPGSVSPRFRSLDRRVYSPLCLTLAALAAPAVARR